jgi:hypothetical protein
VFSIETDSLINWQCAIPVFENLLPEPHNSNILRLLFTFAHWHGLAKLRMHTDATLAVLDSETTALGKQLREFESSTCSIFRTRELKREMRARERRERAKGGRPVIGDQESTEGRKQKLFNLQTYKVHALGDYVSTIQRLGTTDSYTTSIVSHPPDTTTVKGLLCFLP